MANEMHTNSYTGPRLKVSVGLLFGSNFISFAAL